jgi:hypothetical protein
MPSEAALLHFLKPYKRVYNASVCTHAVGHVTFWVYDRGQWIRHDGGKPQPNKSWCHAFFKTVLGLSQTDYDKAKKRLFAGEDLTGVYISGNSFAVVYRPSSTLSRAHIAAIVAGGLVAGGVGLAAKKKFQQKPTSALTANKTPNPQDQASDIKRLKELFIEFRTNMNRNEKIDQQKINEYLKIFSAHENDASITKNMHTQRKFVRVLDGLDFPKLDSVLDKTNQEIAQSEFFSKRNWDDWKALADVFDSVKDLERADKIRTAMYFQQRVSGKDDEAFKQLVCHSLDSNRGERYNNAIKELMEVSKQSNAPVSEVDVYDFKWRCLWEDLANAIIDGKAIDETKLSEFKAISLQLEKYPHRFDETTFKAPDFVSLFLPGGQTLDAMDAILDEGSFERIVQNPALLHVGPASFRLLTWLYELSEKNGNEDDISRLRKSDAAFHYYLIKSMLDRGNPVAGDRYFVELVNYAVMDEIERQSNPDYENEYSTALNELAVRYGEAFQAEVQTCAEQQRKKPL